MKRVLHNLRLAPFEALIGALVVIGGVTQLFGIGVIQPLDALLPKWLVTLTDCVYLVSGGLVLLGVIRRHVRAETGGLTLLAGISVGRAVLYGSYLGWGTDAIVSVSFSLLVVAACVLRLQLLFGKRP